MGGEEHRWGVESGWLRDSGLADGGEERRLGAGEWGTGRVGEGGSGDAAWVKGVWAWLREGGCRISGW